MTLDTYLLYLGAVAVFFATPPDTSQLLIISNSVRHGLKRSFATIVGDLTANCIQMSAAAFGLAAIIATSADAFQWIKWFGVAYLAWIGLQLILSTNKPDAIHSHGVATRLVLFRQGFITSMANPFAVVFFAALFPQFIDATQPVAPQLVVLGSTYLLIDGLLLVIWGWLGVRAAGLITGSAFGLVNKICGSLMIGAALLLAGKDFEPQKQ